MLRSIADRLGEAFTVTIIDTAILKVAYYVSTEFVKAVFFVNE